MNHYETEARNEWINPVESGIITSSCGSRINPIKQKPEFHDGLDIAVPEGTDAVAVCDGEVILTKNSPSFGLMVQIQTPDGYLITYGHLKEILVSKGESVKQGQAVAKTGNTGFSTGPHLHYGLKEGNKIIDPMRFVQLPYTREVEAEYQARGETIGEN